MGIKNENIKNSEAGDESPLNTPEQEESEDGENEIESNKEIDSEGDSNVNIIDSNIGAIINMVREIEDTLFPCDTEGCNTVIDLSNYGKTNCPKCGRSYFRRNTKLQVGIYKTLDESETKQFKKIISHVNNKIKDRNYEEAYRYCLEAEKIAPAESTTWEYYALVEFLFEITKEKAKRKDTQEIIKSVKNHLEKCKDYGVDDSRYEETSGDIANRLFHLERVRIPSVVIRKDRNGNERWLLKDLTRCLSYMKSFEHCYSLYRDVRYLEEYLKELCKPYKWVIKDLDGNLKNLVFIENFHPANKLKYLVSRVKEHKPDFELPEIATERLEILKTESIDQSKIEIISRTKN